tara:strand:+ start:1743 stop:3032 length:1290 start_codon:yes stop_codon:yes gene_type:complete
MKRKKLAIVGSGISGLSAAFFLSKKFDVYLFEKNSVLGGHTRTLNFLENEKKISIDTGFIVFNEKNYHDLTSFFKILEVEYENSEMSFSFSNKNSDFEYGGKNLNTLFAKRKNIFSIKFIFLVFEILRLYKLSKKLSLNFEHIESITIEDFLIKNNFSQNLCENHVYPMVSSIWSSNMNEVKQFPLQSFIKFFSNHGLFNLRNRPQWKFVKGGSNKYITKLLNKKLFKFETNFKIKNISRNNNKIQIINDKKNIYNFDKIILATHADQAIDLINDISSDEVKILSKFNYSKNTAFLHKDETFMPNRKLIWSSWNFLKNTNSNEFSLTYWMNRLQNIPSNKSYFVTINPSRVPKKIIDQTVFEHPIFNLETLKAQKELNKIQGIKNTFYCGSYFGYGFHEDGIQSSAYLSLLMGIDLPWKRKKNFLNRIF